MPALRPRRARTTTILAATAATLLAGAGVPASRAGSQQDRAVANPPASSAQGPSLTSSLSADSGVAVQTLCTNCNNADLSISGMGNEHVEVVCDGIPVPSGLAQIYLLSVIPPTTIDKVAVRKGAGDPGYLGAAVGGGIEVERAAPADGFRVNASADTGSYGWDGLRLDAAGLSGWLGDAVVGSWSKSDKIDANQDGSADLPESDRSTIEGGFDLRPAEAHRIRFGASRYDEEQLDGPAAAYVYNNRTCEGIDEVIFGQPCTEEAGVDYNREDVQLRRDQVDLRYDVTIVEGTKLAATGTYGRRDQDIQETSFPVSQTLNLMSEEDLQELFDTFGLTEEDLENLGLPINETAVDSARHDAYFIDDDSFHGSVSLEQSLGQQATLRAGYSRTGSRFEVIDVRLNEMRAAIQGVSYPLDTKLAENVVETGYFVEADMAVGPGVELSAGVRYVIFEHDDNEDEISAMLNGQRDAWLDVAPPEGGRWLPRAALAWKVKDAWQIRLSAGAGYRAPAPAFDKVCCGRQYRGNRGVALEQSRSLGIEATWQPEPRFKIGASAFVTDFDDLILNIATQSDQFTHTYQNVNLADARNRSLAVEARVQEPSWLTTSVSYTWLDPQNNTPNGEIHALLDFGGTPIPVTFSYDGVPYSTKARGALGLDFRAPGGFTFSFTTQYTGPTLIQSFRADGVAPDLSETDAFFVTNFRTMKEFRNGLSLYFGVDNLLDYVQADGCDLADSTANPALVGCLGDPRFDYNWGPLRGRYSYAGVGYTIGR
jgi:outer membrane receptor for ferrienterochelin and colicins